MNKFLLAVARLLLTQTPGQAQEPDEITKKLAAAKDAFYADRDKADQALLSLLERKEAAAKQAGDIKTLEAIRAETEAFRKQGKLPKLVPPTNYQTAMNLARTKLENVYVSVLKSYLQGDKLEEAKAIQKELQEFQAKLGKLSGDPFVPNSVWGDANGKLVVNQRKNEIIQVTMTSKKGEKVMNGKFQDGKISLLAKDGKAIKGTNPNDVNYEGTVESDDKGYYLNLTWRSLVDKNGSRTNKMRLNE